MSLPYRADIPASIDQCVHDLISARADAQPDTPAVCSDDEILTYGQLDTLSSRLATQLVQLGIKSEVIVPICFESSIWAIVAILAVLKAGGAFTPLHPEHSRSYHEGVLKQVRSKVVLVSSQHSTDWQDASQNIIVVDAESLRRLPSGNKTICTPADHKNAAYVLFTVGDSGASDGVVVEHKALSTSCFHYENVFKMTPQARVLHFAPYSTGISIVETFTSLICGACIFLASIDQFDGLIEVIEHFRINWCHLTSTIAQALDPHNVPSLRTLILSQGSMAHQECKKWGNFVELITTYGPVECSSLCYFIAGSENLTSGIIGKPFASVGWVVEQDNPDRLAPQGVVGELLVEGPILARGYLHDPDKTKKAFVNDPLWLVDGFKGHPGRRGRLYRTGDLVRYDSNNNLIYVGRKASQTTFSSQTLELCAIENGLRKHRYIDECVAVSQKHTGGSAGVVCFATILKDFTDVCSKFSRNSDSQEKDIWEERFDTDTYVPTEDIESLVIGRDFVGWNSMYDGEEIDKTEMNEWLDDTIESIHDNGSLGHVIEIGSGTGMILFNLGETLQSYVGIDPSKRAVEFLTKAVGTIPSLAARVRIHKATAADISKLDPPVIADFAILNSVVQYFPSQEYLYNVLQDLLNIQGIKKLFIGDIRSHALHREFIAAKALRMAGNDASKAQITCMMADIELSGQELLVDPGFFTALPNRLSHLVEHVEILPKKMKATNELSAYRYAAIIHVKGKDFKAEEFREICDDKWLDFVETNMDHASLVRQVKELKTGALAIGNIPNSKVIFSRYLCDSLDNVADDEDCEKGWLLSVEQKAQLSPSLSATDLVEIAGKTGCQVEISWSRQYSQRGSLDAIFHRYEAKNKTGRVKFRFPTDHKDRPLQSMSNKPSWRRCARDVEKRLYERLQLQLSSHQMPQSIKILDSIPRKENGKIDRELLEQMTQGSAIKQDSNTSRISEIERVLQRLWAGLFNTSPESISLEDNFFHLGGNLATAMRLVEAAEKEDILLTVDDICQFPKLVSLASLCIANRDCVSKLNGSSRIECLAF